MTFDCLIVIVVIAFTVLDWCLGLVRDWSVPVSMVIATLIAQHVYVDLATIIAEALHLEATFSVFLAYLIIWFCIAQFCDNLLCHVFKSSDKDPPFVMKILGSLLGFAKGSMGFVLAAMVAYAHSKVPEPPMVSSENNLVISMTSNSFFLPQLHHLARELDEPIGKYVLSDSAPRFRPNFALGDDPLAPIMDQERRKGYKVGKAYNKFDKMLDKVESDF